jgi:hypothetical protein
MTSLCNQSASLTRSGKESLRVSRRWLKRDLLRDPCDASYQVLPIFCFAFRRLGSNEEALSDQQIGGEGCREITRTRCSSFLAPKKPPRRHYIASNTRQAFSFKFNL